MTRTPSKPRRIGYIRTSPVDLPDALHQLAWAELDETFIDENVTSAARGRPQRRKLLASLKAGDTLVVADLNRLARDAEELPKLLVDVLGKGVTVEAHAEAVTLWPSSTEQVDRDVALIVAGLTFARENRTERQGLGIRRATNIRKKYTGAPLKLRADQVAALLERFRKLKGTPGDTATKIAEDFKVSRETMYRYVRAGDKLLIAAQATKRATGRRYRANSAPTEAEQARLSQRARTLTEYAVEVRRKSFEETKGVSAADAVARDEAARRDAAARAELRQQRNPHIRFAKRRTELYPTTPATKPEEDAQN